VRPHFHFSSPFPPRTVASPVFSVPFLCRTCGSDPRPLGIQYVTPRPCPPLPLFDDGRGCRGPFFLVVCKISFFFGPNEKVPPFGPSCAPPFWLSLNPFFEYFFRPPDNQLFLLLAPSWWLKSGGLTLKVGRGLSVFSYESILCCPLAAFSPFTHEKCFCHNDDFFGPSVRFGLEFLLPAFLVFFQPTCFAL